MQFEKVKPHENRLLQTLVVHIFELIKRAGPLRFRHDIGGLHTVQEHVAIYEAISRHDSEEAQNLMRRHLEEARNELA